MSIARGLVGDLDGLGATAALGSSGPTLEELYRAQYRPLVQMAAVMLGDLAAAEEVTQDAFMGAYRAFGRLREPDRLLDYVRGAVLNGCRSALRRQRVAGLWLARQRAASRPQEAVSASEDRDVIVRLVRRLPVRQRECLVLRYYLDLSEADTARTLGISPGAVKQHVHRALAATREQLGGAE